MAAKSCIKEEREGLDKVVHVFPARYRFFYLCITLEG